MLCETWLVKQGVLLLGFEDVEHANPMGPEGPYQVLFVGHYGYICCTYALESGNIYQVRISFNILCFMAFFRKLIIESN